jgi:hypothetical protein
VTKSRTSTVFRFVILLGVVNLFADLTYERLAASPVRFLHKWARRRRSSASSLLADNPGLTLFHCHQQLHMDFGFIALFKYA